MIKTFVTKTLLGLSIATGASASSYATSWSYSLRDAEGNTVPVTEYTHNAAKNDIRHASYLSSIHKTDYKSALNTTIAQRLLSSGMPDQHTKNAALFLTSSFSKNFNLQSTNVMNGPGQLSYRMSSTSLRYNKLPEACMIVSTRDQYTTAAQWASNLSSGKGHLTRAVPKIYDQFFKDQVSFHEQAHCFNANEEEADFLSNLQMRRKYQAQYPAEIEDFLNVIRDMRHHNNSWQKNIKYHHTGNAHTVARQYYQKHGHKLSEQSIWSIATQKTYPNLKQGIYVQGRYAPVTITKSRYGF